jgi:hypothetical protein
MKKLRWIWKFYICDRVLWVGIFSMAGFAFAIWFWAWLILEVLK